MSDNGLSLFVSNSHIDCSLDNFDWTKKEKLRKVIEDVIEGKSKKGLLLIGNPGVGKTHLMVGIFRALLEKGGLIGVDVWYESWAGLIQELVTDIGTGVTLENVVDRVLSSNVVLLDDVKPAAGKIWEDILRKVIVKVYEEERVAVLSTNASSLDELIAVWKLEDYYISRILERFSIIEVVGKDRRVE